MHCSVSLGGSCGSCKNPGDTDGSPDDVSLWKPNEKGNGGKKMEGCGMKFCFNMVMSFQKCCTFPHLSRLCCVLDKIGHCDRIDVSKQVKMYPFVASLGVK